MQLRCAKCDKTLQIPDDAAGKKVRCPACMAMMIAPQLGGSAPAPPFSASTGVPHAAEDQNLPFATAAPSGSRSKVHCPNCDRPLSLTADVAGQIVACPGCRKRMKMPLEIPSPATRSSYSSGTAPTTTRDSAVGSDPFADVLPTAANPYSTSGPPLGQASSRGANPYQTPIGGTGMMMGGHSEPIVYVLPGIFLAVVAGLSVLISGVQVFFGLLGGVNVQAPDAIVLVLFVGIPLLINLVIVAGGVQMARQRSLTLCRVAAVLAIIPFFGFCCIGNTPIGIWAMVVLMMDNANRDFH